MCVQKVNCSSEIFSVQERTCQSEIVRIVSSTIGQMTMTQRREDTLRDSSVARWREGAQAMQRQHTDQGEKTALSKGGTFAVSHSKPVPSILYPKPFSLDKLLTIFTLLAALPMLVDTRRPPPPIQANFQPHVMCPPPIHANFQPHGMSLPQQAPQMPFGIHAYSQSPAVQPQMHEQHYKVLQSDAMGRRHASPLVRFGRQAPQAQMGVAVVHNEQLKKRESKVLAIVDAETNEIINEADIHAAAIKDRQAEEMQARHVEEAPQTVVFVGQAAARAEASDTALTVPVRSSVTTPRETTAVSEAQSRLNVDAPVFVPVSGYYSTSHAPADAIVPQSMSHFASSLPVHETHMQSYSVRNCPLVTAARTEPIVRASGAERKTRSVPRTREEERVELVIKEKKMDSSLSTTHEIKMQPCADSVPSVNTTRAKPAVHVSSEEQEIKSVPSVSEKKEVETSITREKMKYSRGRMVELREAVGNTAIGAQHVDHRNADILIVEGANERVKQLLSSNAWKIQDRGTQQEQSKDQMEKIMSSTNKWCPSFAFDRSAMRGPIAAGGKGAKQAQLGRVVIERKSQADIKLHEQSVEKKFKPISQQIKEESDEEKKARLECEKRVRGLLNRISPDNFEQLVIGGDAADGKRAEWDELYDEKYVDSILDILFAKAVDEPRYCALYCNICELQIEKELENKDDGATHCLFRNELLRKTQRCFEEGELNAARAALKKAEARVAELEKRLSGNEERTDEEKAELKKAKADADSLTEKHFQLRRRQFGNLQFIGLLYKCKRTIVTLAILNRCFVTLWRRVKEARANFDEMLLTLPEEERKRKKLDDDSIRCAYQLLGNVGVNILGDTVGASRIPQGIKDGKEVIGFTPEGYLKTILAWLLELKSIVILKHRFAIEDLEKLEYSREAWAAFSAKSSLAPKKKVEVAKEREEKGTGPQVVAPQQMRQIYATPTQTSAPELISPLLTPKVEPPRPPAVVHRVSSKDRERAAEDAGKGRLSAAFESRLRSSGIWSTPLSLRLPFDSSKCAVRAKSSTRQDKTDNSADDRKGALDAARAMLSISGRLAQQEFSETDVIDETTTPK